MQRTEIGRIVPGTVYRFHLLRAVRRDGERVVEDVTGDLYRVEGFALDAVHRREVVVYAGLDGPDAGRLLVCTLADFAVKFWLEPAAEAAPEPPAEAAPEKTMTVKEGSGF